MTIRRQTLIAAALALLGVACSDATGPIEVRATVVVPDTLVSTRMSAATTEWLQFVLPISIHNTASVPLTYFHCGSRIETQSAGAWTTVWAPYCLMSLDSASSPILPGETRVLSMTITAGVAGNAGPKWDNVSIGGTYRLVAAMVPEGLIGAMPMISSNAFVLKPGN